MSNAKHFPEFHSPTVDEQPKDTAVASQPDNEPESSPTVSTTGAPKKKRTCKVFVSLYITSFREKLRASELKRFLPNLNFDNITETEYGFIINKLSESYVRKITKMNLAKLYNESVFMVPLLREQYTKVLTFKDIPWCIRNEELESCLRRENINYVSVARQRSTILIQTEDYNAYHRLKEEGINFYDSVRFRPIMNGENEMESNDEYSYDNDDLIQCYRCQGFWHTAAECRQDLRCVRCGEEHTVDDCDRPKDSPICCNCYGSHHAADKSCSMRQKLKKMLRVKFAMEPQK